MPLINFLRPKWQHGRVEVRLAAVRAMRDSEVETLLTIIRDDDSHEVRLAALEKINDLNRLEDLVRFDLLPEVRRAVRRKISRELGALVLQGADGQQIDDLLLRIDEPDTLLEIATSAVEPETRLKAVRLVDDEELLCAIIEQHCGKLPALAALDKINDPPLLERAAQRASGKTIRRLAREKLAALQAASHCPSAEEIHERELRQYIAEAEELCASIKHDYAGRRMEELEQAWQHIDPAASHPLRSSFEAIQQRFFDRHKDLVLEQQEEGRREEEYARLIDAYEEACSAIEGLVGSLDQDAAARFQEAEARWNSLGTEHLDAVFSEFAARFERACQDFHQASKVIADERAQLAALQAQGQKVAELLEREEPARAASEFAGLERQLGGAVFSYLNFDPFRQELDGLRQRLAGLREQQALIEQQVLAANRQQRQAICEALEGLINAEDRLAAEKQGKALRVDWEGLPRLADDAEAEVLGRRFREALTAFQARQQDFYNQEDWRRWAAKTRKEELCLIAEALDREEDLGKTAEVIKDIQAQWKEVGPVPKEDVAPLWERFSAACERNFTRCQPFFEEQERARAASLERKDVICQRAESLAASTAWKEAGDELKALQAEWKTLPFTVRADEDRLYKRLRSACDLFFTRSQEHFRQLDAERQEHYAAKVRLCATVEELAAQPTWEHGRRVRDLQQQWKKIGPAPRNLEQEVWVRFRAACDKFYGWLDRQRQENLQRKLALCEQVEALVAAVATPGDATSRVAAELSELQKQWQEIGPVPNQDREAAWERFRKPCDAFFQLRRENAASQDSERQDNQARKEALFLQAEELLQAPQDKATGEKLKELQRQWREIGPAPGPMERQLHQQFRQLCNGFFEDRRHQVEQLQAERLENLKQKEAVCLQLENILGLESGSAGGEAAAEVNALSLAERFKLSRESNFMLAGQRQDKQRLQDEIHRLQQEWKKIGPVPREHDAAMRQRYHQALDAFYKRSKSKA